MKMPPEERRRRNNIAKKKYRASVKGKTTLRAYLDSPKGKAARAAADDRKVHRFMDRKTARVLVYRALQEGKLQKPKRCQRCHRAKPLEAHHHKGYAKEHRLDVQWLCQPCHREVDSYEDALGKT